MKLKLTDLWQLQGKIDRQAFVVWGVALFLVKYTLDWLLVTTAFGAFWPIFDYFDELVPGAREASPPGRPGEFLALFAVAMPFLWAGVALCLKRLRSSGLPLWWVALFVVPALKWALFLLLAFTPERDEQAPPSLILRRAPKSSWVNFSIAVAASVGVALGAIALGTKALGEYGWALFVGTPFIMGFVAALFGGATHKTTLGQSIAAACVAVTIGGIALVALALEGGLCLVMAAPLAYVGAIVGAAAGHAALEIGRSRTPQLFCAAVAAMPLMLGVEKIESTEPPLFRVETRVEVAAPVETVWRHVIEFSELPPPKEELFKLGIAYPIRASISGHGRGAVRSCVFSTGPFIEPIEQWNEPTLLQFSVASNPEPLQEWTPYSAIHPAHLRGFLVSEKGQFELKPLSPAKTLLIGTTWYRHSMWPAAYWRFWSDKIIHAIHQRVLNHIKEVAELEASNTRRKTP